MSKSDVDTAFEKTISKVISKKKPRKINLEAARERTRKWNAKNPERKRENDAKWAKKNGAAAAKRYRQRKKEESK